MAFMALTLGHLTKGNDHENCNTRIGYGFCVFEHICACTSWRRIGIETRVPIPLKPGRPARHDYEYERNQATSVSAPVARIAWITGRRPDANSSATSINAALPTLPA
jgi:hypothetical protein